MAKVGVIMGSKSDLPIMQEAIDILNEFGIENDVDIVSAHRTPEKNDGIWEKCSQKRVYSNYSWCWWSSTSSWNDGFNYTSTCHWSSN